MGHNNILELFFEEPNRMFRVREIARLTKIPKTTVSRRLSEMVKETLIIKKKENIEGFIANESNPSFRMLKKLRFAEKLHNSGLILQLEELFRPRCIILFGSFSKGEYNKESDIDIFVQAKEKGCDLSKFERKLKHKISLFFEEDIKKLSNELFNNVINGIKLSGYIKIR